jgi:hypothetical protein
MKEDPLFYLHRAAILGTRLMSSCFPRTFSGLWHLDYYYFLISCFSFRLFLVDFFGFDFRKLKLFPIEEVFPLNLPFGRMDTI